MKKVFILSLALASVLSASSIDFKEAKPFSSRETPNSKNAILSYHDVLKQTTGSIVHIATKQENRQVQQMLGQMHPFFEQCFGPNFKPKNAPKRQGLGSGVIVSEDGYIITNNHVVENADEIIVTVPGETKEYEAKVIGTDAKSDIAVIKVEADDLTPIRFGSSANLEVGDVVFAIGNPFGVGQTVTHGIISAQHKNSVGINEYENFIQTDAPINPGNSGGALVDSRGVLIGINTAIITRSGGNNGIGFAIEVDMVKNIAQKLIDHGTVERGYLGVNIGNLTKELRNVYKNKEGAMLLEVHEDTPAQKAGLKRGDLIIEVDGKSVKSAAELKNRIGMHAPGTEVTVTYERDKRIKTTTVTLDSLSYNGSEESSEVLEGLELSLLNDNARYHYRIPHSVDGILISTVAADSEAEKQGLREGDVIVQIEDFTIGSMSDLHDALKKYKGVYKRIYINRGGRVFVVALK